MNEVLINKNYFKSGLFLFAGILIGAVIMGAVGYKLVLGKNSDFRSKEFIRDSRVFEEIKQGDDLMSKNKTRDALFHYRTAIDLNPDIHAGSYYKLGIALMVQKRYEEAIDVFKKALELKPEYPEAYYNMGLSYYTLKRYRDAVLSFEKAIELKPEYPEAYYFTGLTYSMLQRYKYAIMSFKKALELKEDYSFAYKGLAEVYLNMKEYGLAQKMFLKAAFWEIKRGADAEELTNLFRGLYKRDLYKKDSDKHDRSDDYKYLDETKKDAVRTGMDDAETYYRLGSVLWDMERYNEAVDAYDMAIKMKSGGNTPFYYFLKRGFAYVQLGVMEKAMSDLNRAAQLINIQSGLHASARER